MGSILIHMDSYDLEKGSTIVGLQRRNPSRPEISVASPLLAVVAGGVPRAGRVAGPSPDDASTEAARVHDPPVPVAAPAHGASMERSLDTRHGYTPPAVEARPGGPGSLR